MNVEYEVVSKHGFMTDKVSEDISDDLFRTMAEDGWRIAETIEQEGTTTYIVFEREIPTE